MLLAKVTNQFSKIRDWDEGVKNFVAVCGVNAVVDFRLYFEPEHIVVSDRSISCVQIILYSHHVEERMRNQRLEAKQAFKNLNYTVNKSHFVLQDYVQKLF